MVLQSFNPTLVPPETLKELFVQREEELDRLLKRIKSVKKDGTKPQFVIIGPRGIGKTHFMLIIYYKIKDQKELRNNWISLKFTEEEYMIDSIASLFIRILEELMEEEQTTESKEILDFLSNVENLGDEEIIDTTTQYLKKIHDTKRKGIVVLIDNINDIFEQIKQIKGDKELGHLRAILMENNFLMIIGGAVTYFNQIRNYNEPFYNFFEPIRLNEFTADNIEFFIKKLAMFEKRKEILENFEKKYKPRIKTLVHFTGGNPRLVLEMYYVLSDFRIEEVRESLEMLLNQITPYYQGIMAGLSPQQRKIFDTMALIGGPATPTEIAKKARMDRNKVTSQMKRLEKDGLIRLSKQKQRKTRRYEITERFFRIWREMRKTKGNKRVGYLVNFLKHFYSETEIIGLFKQFEQLYLEKSKNGEISECRKLVDYMGYLTESVPPKLSIDMGCNILEKYLEIGDIESAEYELIRVKEMVDFVGDKKDKKLAEHEIKIYLLKVRSLIEKGNFKEAMEVIIKILKIDFKNKNTIKLIDKIIDSDPNNEKALHWKGRVFLHSKSYDRAIGTFDRVLKLNSKNEDALMDKGGTFFNAGRYEEAVDAFDKVIKMNPKNENALLWEGRTFFMSGKFDEAIKSFDKVVKLNPKNENALLWKGRTFFMSGKFDKALKSFDEVIKSNPKNENVLIDKGRTFLVTREYDKAIKLFEKVIKLNPKNESALLWKGKTFFITRKYDKAIKSFEKVIKLNPKNENALIDKGETFLIIEKYEEAIKLFNKVIKLNPKNENAVFLKGKTFFNTEKYNEAMKLLDNVLDLNPKNEAALGMKGCTFCKMGEYNKAKETFDKITKLNPENELAWETKGHVLDKLKKYKGAIKAYDKVLHFNPKNEDALVEKGIMLTRLKKFEEALRIFNKVLELNPKNEKALMNKGRTFRDSGNYEEAIELFDKVIELNPKNVSALGEKGCSLCKIKEYESAKEIFDKIIKIDTKSERAWKSKGHVLGKLENFKEAIKAYDNVLKLNPKDEETLVEKGSVLVCSEKLEEALELFDRTLELNPKNEDALYWKGIAFSRSERYNEAIKLFDEVLKLNPENENALMDKGSTFLNSEKFKDALDIYNHILTINSKNEIAWKDKGISYFMINDIEGLIKWFNEVLKINAKVDENWLFKSFRLEKNVEQENMLLTIKKISDYKGKISNKEQFKTFIDKVTLYTVKEVLRYSLRDLEKQNYGNSEKKLTLLFDNHMLWKDLEVYAFIIDYLIEVLKVDFENGETIFNRFKVALGEEFTNTFEPIELSIAYLKEEDTEVLERLHPEVREVVEQIVDKIESQVK